MKPTKKQRKQANQHGDGLIGGKTWEELKKKHAEHEGTRLEKSLRPVVILSRQRGEGEGET